MSDKVYIKQDFKKELDNLNCGLTEDYITITRTEGEKIFFKYGRCKLHITRNELEEVRLEA